MMRNIIMFMILILLVGCAPNLPAEPKQSPDDVLATVNGNEITRQMVYDNMPVELNQPRDVMLRWILRTMITDMLTSEMFDEYNITVTDQEVRDRIDLEKKRAGKTNLTDQEFLVEEYNKNTDPFEYFAFHMKFEKLAQSFAPNLTDEDLRRVYDANKAAYYSDRSFEDVKEELREQASNEIMLYVYTNKMTEKRQTANITITAEFMNQTQIDSFIKTG